MSRRVDDKHTAGHQGAVVTLLSVLYRLNRKAVETLFLLWGVLPSLASHLPSSLLSPRYQCFKSAWMYEVLHSGFRFPIDYPDLRTAQLVYDKEVQWTLGAILYKTRFLPLR